MEKSLPPEIDQYPSAFKPEVQQRFAHIRGLILEIVPESTEGIRYGVPTWICKKNLIHVGLYPHHIGIYPAPRTHPDFESELKNFKGGKGTLQIPHGQPLPVDLLKRIVLYRLEVIQNKGRG